MAFDYEAVEIDDEKVRAVASEMTGGGLAPLTEQQIAEREEWRRDYLAGIEQERADAERLRLVQEREREAVAQREAAIAAQQACDKALAKRQHQIDLEVNRRSLMDLRMSAARQDTFRQSILNAQASAVRQQNISNILSEINAMANPPPPSEPSIVVVEADQEDDTFCGVKVTRPNPRRSWW